MTEFRIRDDISLPPIDICGRGRKEKYPFSKLEVGQSFFVPGEKSTRMSGTASKAGKRLGVKFATRTFTDEGVTGVLVYRTA